MHAALDINRPNYASAIPTADEVSGLIFSLQPLGIQVYCRNVLAKTETSV